MRIHKTRIEILIKIWKNLELKQTSSKKVSFFISQDVEAEKLLEIPNMVKRYFIRKFLNSKLLFHSKAMIKYQDTCRKLEDEFMDKFAEREMEAIMYGKKVKLEEVCPTRPSLILFKDYKGMRDLIR